MMADGVQLAKALAKFASEKQAEDIVVLNLEGISTITDYFVICTGTSMPHLKAVRREIVDQCMRKLGAKPASSDGSLESQWVVMDFGDVVVHVFHKDKREFYALEDLWSDALRVELDDVGVEAGAVL